jgi:2-polyprenyl-3-methyl-5-hydroxy-6-metoxy-1,4-benzoquinol methylase
LEVFEHLVEADQIKIIQECKNLVLPWGKIVISVPIETGISGFFKNALRYIIGQSHAENLKEVFQAFFSMPVKRNVVNGYIYSHVGFRYKDLEKLLSAQNLKIKNRIFSPFNFLDRLFNSQVFYIIDANEQYTIRLTRKLASSKSSLPSLPTSDSMRVM